MADAYYLACNVQDYDPQTGVCAAPYYGSPPQFVPTMTAQEGLEVAFAIVGTWCIGLVARLLIRAGQQGMKS